MNTLRKGPQFVCVNPFTPEEEWLRVEELSAIPEWPPADAPTIRITKIDLKRKTITLE